VSFCPAFPNARGYSRTLENQHRTDSFAAEFKVPVVACVEMQGTRTTSRLGSFSVTLRMQLRSISRCSET